MLEENLTKHNFSLSFDPHQDTTSPSTMAQGCPPPNPPPNGTPIYKFDFSKIDVNKEAAKRKAKDEQLRANPDCLFEHDTKHGIICSVIFFTKLKDAWLSALMDFYPKSRIEEVPNKPDRKKIVIDEGGCIMMYDSGKFCFLENCNLKEFIENFENIKKNAVMRGIESMTVTAGNDNEEGEDNKIPEDEGEDNEDNKAKKVKGEGGGKEE